jgi:hypothetical protein
MKRYVLVLALFLSFQPVANAERVTGPVDLRDKPGGKTIVSLQGDADVDCIAFKDDWYIVLVEAIIAKNDLTGQDKIHKKRFCTIQKQRDRQDA